MDSFALPSYWRQLADPDIKNILVVGTGGGFDFVHSLTLFPELKRMGKNIIIGSYSFGSPHMIRGGEVVFEPPTPPSSMGLDCTAKLINGSCEPDPKYGPEVGVCQFLDKKFPESAPHSCYAFYARAFSVPLLTQLYTILCTKHDIDAIICMDGGSDSLMRGDEAGLGDPIEDAVTVSAVHNVAQSLKSRIKASILISIGFGCDRFNGVTDSASMRAIAEITAAGGYLGSLTLEKNSPLTEFYDEAIEFLQERASFRSVIANTIIEASRGAYGADNVPPTLQRRVRKGELFIWPLMAMHFAFSVSHLFERSMCCQAIKDAPTVDEAYMAFHAYRDKLRKNKKILPKEDLPRCDAESVYD